jgi:hypothetical protein
VALAIDASSPAVATSTTSTVTSASFTPPTGSLLDIEWTGDTVLATNPSAPSITDNLGGHLTYALQGWQSRADSPTVDGQCAIWTAVIAGSAAMTITATNNAGANLGGTLKIRAWTDGANTPGIGAKGKAGSSSAGSIAQSYTAVSTGGQGCIVVCDDDEKGAETAGTGCTMDASGNVSAHNSYGYCRRSSADDTGGSSNTLNVTIPATSANLGWVYVEIIPAVTSIPFNPQRGASPRDYGEVQWIQRDRRDANTVGSAANPLVSPLDSAWQAGGLYWHLYAGAVDNMPRTWRAQQRPYISDPSLLGTALLENVLLGSADDVRRRSTAAAEFYDRREMPQQRPYVSDPLLLTTALLENVLLGSFDDVHRHGLPAAYVDRREVPQQRAYVSDPLLLAAALLENELLGGADTAKRYLQPATVVDRREVPAQRPYVSDPSMLVTALLENGLLGGADTGKRYLTPAYGDRREVPQQRLYVSDPALLATAELENELLGSAGTPQRYTTAASNGPRWWMPQQPKRDASTPGLLDSALLENELLGSVDDLRRHGSVSVYADRREVPQQRAYVFGSASAHHRGSGKRTPRLGR